MADSTGETTPVLLLVPTAREARSLLPNVALSAPGRAVAIPHAPGWSAAICGFGLVAASAVSAALLARGRTVRCVLAGIAGSYDLQRAPVGTVVRATRVVCHGIGVGEGAGHLTARELGFPQLPGDDRHAAIHDEVDLRSHPPSDAMIPGVLLSAAAGSADASEAHARRRRHPEALAEDLESFGVALAARLLDVDLEILRGISNEAGDRRKERWRIDAALDALRTALTSRWTRS